MDHDQRDYGLMPGPTYPGVARAIGDLGPGTLAPGAAALTSSMLSNIVQQGIANGDPVSAVLAQLLQRQVPVNCNYAAYPVTVNPDGAGGGTEICVVIQQVLPQNLSRKAFAYVSSSVSGGINNDSNCELYGFLFQSGPVAPQVLLGAQASQYMSNIVPGYDSNALNFVNPAPTSPITACFVYGTQAGPATGPSTTVFFEGT